MKDSDINQEDVKKFIDPARSLGNVSLVLTRK